MRASTFPVNGAFDVRIRPPYDDVLAISQTQFFHSFDRTHKLRGCLRFTSFFAASCSSRRFAHDGKDFLPNQETVYPRYVSLNNSENAVNHRTDGRGLRRSALFFRRNGNRIAGCKLRVIPILLIRPRVEQGSILRIPFPRNIVSTSRRLETMWDRLRSRLQCNPGERTLYKVTSTGHKRVN